MKPTCIFVVFFALIVFTSPSFAAKIPAPTNQFSTEDAAKQYCDGDVVVWLNLNSGLYHYKGGHWYGNTKNGTYVCEQEADQAGDRAAPNGQ